MRCCSACTARIGAAPEASDSISRIDDLVQEFDNGVIQVSPALTVFEKLSKTVMSIGGKLGLSPADREKLASFARIEKEEDDPYEALKQRQA